MEIGNTVKVVAPVLSGPITDTRYNKDAKSLEHLVEFQMDGEAHQRWFLERELEVV